MAKYFNDFSQYTVDTEPADFTRRWESNLIGTVRDDAGAQNGRVLDVVQSGGDGRNLLSWDAIDADTDRDNVETLVRFFKPVAASDARSALRASGTGSETGYTAGYVGQDDAIRHGRYVNGSFSNLGNFSLIIPTGSWYYQRVRLFGSTLKTKVWPDDGTTETEGWSLEESDSGITQAGWVGLFAFIGASETLFDFFSVGTNGDPAPTEPVGGGGEFISELTPRTETSQVQPLALSAGSTQSLTPSSSTAQTVNLFMVAGNSQSVDPITDSSQTQLQQLISGFSVALLPASDTSATQELGFIGGVKDDLIVALVPATDASALQDLQVRLGQLQQATPESDTSTLMTLNLVAGTSVPFSAVLSPGVDSAALQAQGFVAGLSAESEPVADTQGLVTLDDRTGQIISLDPAIESSITQTLGLFTGVVIGKFTRSSVLELSPQYSVSELSTAYDIIEQTPVYSVKEI